MTAPFAFFDKEDALASCYGSTASPWIHINKPPCKGVFIETLNHEDGVLVYEISNLMKGMEITSQARGSPPVRTWIFPLLRMQQGSILEAENRPSPDWPDFGLPSLQNGVEINFCSLLIIYSQTLCYRSTKISTLPYDISVFSEPLGVANLKCSWFVMMKLILWDVLW